MSLLRDRDHGGIRVPAAACPVRCTRICIATTPCTSWTQINVFLLSVFSRVRLIPVSQEPLFQYQDLPGPLFLGTGVPLPVHEAPDPSGSSLTSELDGFPRSQRCLVLTKGLNSERSNRESGGFPGKIVSLSISQPRHVGSARQPVTSGAARVSHWWVAPRRANSGGGKWGWWRRSRVSVQRSSAMGPSSAVGLLLLCSLGGAARGEQGHRDPGLPWTSFLGTGAPFPMSQDTRLDPLGHWDPLGRPLFPFSGYCDAPSDPPSPTFHFPRTRNPSEHSLGPPWIPFSRHQDPQSPPLGLL